MNRAAKAAQGVILGGLCALAGCGGSAAAPAAAPEVAAEPSPAAPVTSPPADPVTEVDALLHDLRVQAERLDAELDRKEEEAALLESRDRSRTDDLAGSGAQAPRKPRAAESSGPRPKDSAPKAAEPSSAPARTESGLGGPCDTACRALASMERSANRICELVGEPHEHCVNARALYEKSRARLTSSRCWCQSFGPPPPT
jgi:hypothetical protein